MPPKRPRRVTMPVYFDPAQKVAIMRLSKATRVPAAVYLREAVDDLLKKYAKTLKGGR